MRLRDLPIRQKLMAALLVTSSSVLLLACVAFITYEIIAFRKNMVESYATRAAIIAANSTAALAFQNEADATEVLGALKTDPQVTLAGLYDDKGKLFAKYPADAATEAFPRGSGESGFRPGYLETFRLVVQDGRILGTVYLRSDLSALTQHYQAYALLSAGIIAGSLLLAYLLSHALQKQISGPILELSWTAKAITGGGVFSVRAKKISQDEMGDLTDAFNQMLAEVQNREKALKASEERFRAMIENNVDGIAVSGPDGAALYVSPALARMLGVSEEELVGKSRKDLVHPDDADYVVKKMNETLQNPGKIIQARYRLRHKDGSWRWIDMTATNLLDNPAIGGIVRNIRDITEKLQMEEIARIGEAQAIENIKDYAIIMLDKDGKVLTWNAGAEHIKGYKASEIIGKPMSSFYTPEDNARGHAEELLKTAEKEGHVEEEGWRQKKDGTRFLGDVVITALRDEKNEIRGFVKVTRDITEKRKAQQELQEKTQLLDSVMKNIGDGVCVANEKGEFLMFNASAERILGLGPLAGGPGEWSEQYGVFMPDGKTPLPAEENPLAKAIRGEATQDVEVVLRNARNPLGITISVDGSPLRDEKDVNRGGVVFFRDITEQKRQVELRNYTKALELSNKEMQDFIFVVSHDLQEPLRKIQSFGNFLKEEAGPILNEESSDYLKRMQDAARRMSLLIEDLLQLTRITTRAKPFEPVELSNILQDVVADLEIRLKETGGKVVAADLPRLEADPTQMRQLFQNLIANSLKFRKKDVTPVIEVKGEKDEKNNHCVIRVSDNGIGFEPKYADKIFNIFQRLHGSEYEGTGIGLSICKKVVERHRGTIQAKSYLGQGAVFEITLPLRQS